MEVAKLLEEATKILKEAGCENPRLDAEILLAHTLQCQRFELYQNKDKIADAACKRFQSLISRRQKREPIAYITGVKEFWSIPIQVTQDVLIPRPETESLVEKVLERVPTHSIKILDLCTGSGCITAALASELPQAEFVASDISKEALKIAKENLKQYGKRVTLLQSDLFEKIEGLFDMIVSNPPYLPSFVCDTLQPEISQFEPRLALDGGEDGLDFIRRIRKNAKKFLKTNGLLAVEKGEEILIWKN